MGKKVDYLIKYVYPDWMSRDDMDYEVGFNSKYRNVLFPIGGKLLIYIVDYQIIVGAYNIVGKFYEDRNESKHPLRLPLRKIYRIENDALPISYKQIRRVVPDFKPNELISYWPINEKQYYSLENLLIK